MPHGRKATAQKKRDPLDLAGKDEMNLSDWRIGIATHQQLRTKGGGKIDLVEYTIPRSHRPDQRITLEAPSRKGLPTPGDEDVLLGLLALAKEQEFQSDILHFVPRRLIQVLRWPLKQGSWDRLELALKRLCAVTITYEFAWYDKLTAEVEPILITGILAEAKLVRRRGRIANEAVPDSYVQWTNDFFKSIKSGNLTNLDLGFYFSLRRPGSKQLYRHLNKRFYGRRRQQTYDRDLSHLACGHLGMTQSKNLKENFHKLVRELEDAGYLSPRSIKDRYSKVRPGVYRVHFDPPLAPSKSNAETGANTTADQNMGVVDADARLVCAFHKQYANRNRCSPANTELKHAKALLEQHDEQLVFAALPCVIESIHRAGFTEKAKYFGASVRFFADAINTHQKRADDQQRDQQRRAKDARENAQRQQQVAREREATQRLREQFLDEPLATRERFFQQALDETPTDFQRDVIRRQGCDEGVNYEVLQLFARSVASKD